MKARAASPLNWLALLLALYLCAPFVAGLPQIGLADWHGMASTTLARALCTSVASASVATLLIALGGIPLGYLLAHSSSRRMALLGFVVQLPLALPPLVSGVLLLFLLGPYSPLANLFGGLTDTFSAIVLAQVFVAAPFLIIAARSAFGALDRSYEDVAATLGHGAWQNFIAISLPLAWPTIRAGLLLSWLRAFGEFGATMMVAYHPYSLPVYTYVAFGSQGLPAMLPLLLPTIAIAVGVALLAAWRRRPAAAHIADTPLAQHSLLVPLSASGASGIISGLSGLSGMAAPGSASGPDTGRPPAEEYLRVQIRQRIGNFELNLDWQAQARRLAIVGPSGSGKSLTLRLIAGLDQARHGASAAASMAAPAASSSASDAVHCSVSLGGQIFSALPPSARQLGYVPQDYGLFPHMTVAQQLAFPLGAQLSAARDWLLHLGLAGLEARKPAALSLGQQQRVALARALVRPCRLILLDEPFSALDTPRRRQLRQTLRAVQNEISATTVLVTHDPDEAALLADEILVLDQGRVLQVGTTAELFSRPNNLQVAALLGIENIGRGIYLGRGAIDIGAGLQLAIAPAEVPRDVDAGTAVLWRLPRRAISVVAQGGYPAQQINDARQAGTRILVLDLAGTRINVESDLPCAPGAELQIAIGGLALEIWRERQDASTAIEA